MQRATSEFYRHRDGNNSEPKLSPAEAWAKMSPESVQRLEGLIKVKKMQLWAVAALAMVTALAGALLLRSAHISRSIPNRA